MSPASAIKDGPANTAHQNFVIRDVVIMVSARMEHVFVFLDGMGDTAPLKVVLEAAQDMGNAGWLTTDIGNASVLTAGTVLIVPL